MMSSLYRPPVPARSPPNVNIMSYAERNNPTGPTGVASLHPYLAHLAGVAADPKLGLNPTASPAAAAAVAAAAAGGGVPPASPFHPVASAAGTPTPDPASSFAAAAAAAAAAANNPSVITSLYQSALLSNPSIAAQLWGAQMKQEQVGPIHIMPLVPNVHD